MTIQELAPIALESQGKGPLVLVGGGLAAIVLGALLGALGRAMGIPEKVTYAFPLVLGLGALAFAVWYSVAPQGWVVLTGETLSVEPRMKAPRVWNRGTSTPTLRGWQLRTEGVTRTAGALLAFDGREGTFTLGSRDPALGRRLPLPEGLTLLVPPDYLVARDDFVALAGALGVELPRGGDPTP